MAEKESKKRNKITINRNRWYEIEQKHKKNLHSRVGPESLMLLFIQIKKFKIVKEIVLANNLSKSKH